MKKKVDKSKLCYCIKTRPHDPALHDRFVPPKLDRRDIVFVGMAPGHEEALGGEYFVGAAGKHLRRSLRYCKIPDSAVGFLNVSCYWPRYHDLNNLTEKQRNSSLERLFSALREIRPQIIVPLGNDALSTVQGINGVTKWWGSVLRGEYGWVLPTIHPSAVIRDWDFDVKFIHDLRKVKALWDGEDVLPPKRRFVTPLEGKYKEYCDKVLLAAQNGATIAADIETYQGKLACIAFSFDESWAVSVKGEDREIWESVLHSGCPIVWHNAMFDVTYLKTKYGVTQSGPIHDTQFMWHTISPELACSTKIGKSLAVLTSLYTNDNYYKDDGKDWRKVKDWQKFYEYNAHDAAVTKEIARKLSAQLDRDPVLRKVYKFECDLLEPYMDSTIRGVKIDTTAMEKLANETRVEIAKTEKRLEEIGGEFNPRSWQQVLKVSNDLGIPLKTTNVESLFKASQDFEKGTEAREFLDLIMRHRELQKAFGTYYSFDYDPDNRVRTNWIIPGTETGRMANSTSIIFNKGVNLMTIPKEARKFFIPDEGFTMVYADISQAEPRLVAYLAGCQRLIDALENKEYDGYRWVASWMYNKHPKDITVEERYLAKRCVLGLLYGMGPKTWMEQVNLDKGYKYMDLKEATRLYELFFATFPEIRTYHSHIEHILEAVGYLYTLPPVIRSRMFRKRMGKYDDHTKREAYDYIPQGTVPGVVNNGVLKIYRERGDDVMLLAQIHDAWLGQIRKNENLENNIEFVRECLTYPLDIVGFHDGKERTLVMPVEVTTGKNWGELG